MREVACPVALHLEGVPRRIAGFVHPSAGMQLVKGHSRLGESSQNAAARALFEQSGLRTRVTRDLGTSDTMTRNSRWRFSLCCLSGPLSLEWRHLDRVGGGPSVRWLWLALDDPAPAGLRGPSLRAFEWIRAAL